MTSRRTCVVKLDEVAPLLPVRDGGGGRQPGRCRRRVPRAEAGVHRLGGGQQRPRPQQDGPVDVAGGLRLVAVVLHDVGEVLVERLARHLPGNRQ